MGAQRADTAASDKKRRTTGYLAALGAAAFAGLIPVFSKRDLATFDPLIVAGLTNFLAGAVLLPLAPKPPFKRPDFVLVGAIAALGCILAPALFFVGLRDTSASEAAMLVNVETVGTLVFAVFLLRERAGRVEVAAVVGIVAGAVVLATDLSLNIDAAHLRGNLLIIAGAVAWSMDNTISAGLARRNRPLAVAAWKNGVGATVMLGIALAVGADFSRVPESLPIFILVGAVGIGVSLTLFYISLKHIDAYRTSAIFGMQGIFAAGGAFVFLGERLSLVQIGAAAVMILAVTGLALLHKPQADTPKDGGATD